MKTKAQTDLRMLQWLCLQQKLFILVKNPFSNLLDFKIDQILSGKRLHQMFQILLRSFRPINIQGFFLILHIDTHGAKNPRQSKYVITMPMAYQHARNLCRLDASNTHLPLYAFSTIHQNQFLVVLQQNSGLVAILGGLHTRCS